MKKASIVISFFLLLFFSSNLYSYEVKTHEEITEYAFSKSISMRDFLGDINYSFSEKIAIKSPLPYGSGTGCPDCSTKSILDWFKTDIKT
jgi:hypothetical protein